MGEGVPRQGGRSGSGAQRLNPLDRAAARGYEALIALDVDQLADPDECKQLKDAGLHHISLRQGRRVSGRKRVARVIASIVVAMPNVLKELDGASGQRIVEITLLTGSKRHEIFDPRRERARYPYWPR
jgi:hypothetical protein